MENMLIAIAGGTGSGKSTFTDRLKEEFKEEISVISFDNYYKSQAHIPYELRTKINYDSPDAFEMNLLLKQIKQIKAGHSIQCPLYDFVTHTRKKETKLIESKRVIILEGIYALYNDELREMSDIKVYVEADADERILRRIIRDVAERGRDIEGIAKQYLETVKPMHYAYVEPTKCFADIILNSGMNDVAFELLKLKIADALG